MTPRNESKETSLEDLEIELLLIAVFRRYGYDFQNYAKASLRRRIRRAVQESGVKNVSRLQERLLHRPDSLREFVSTLSVHVTSLFRDPDFYAALRKEVVPMLRTYPLVRVWVAGCATGEEVYSLAILLQEEGIYERCRIYATDISDDLLQQASRGEFPLERMKLYTQNYLRAGGKQEFSSYYRVYGEVAAFDPSLKRGLIFSQHNLAADGAFNEFQLVLCRNVMIYFNDTLRHRVQSLLFESLGNFGVLGLGLKESIRFTPHTKSFVDLNAELRLYKKIGG